MKKKKNQNKKIQMKQNFHDQDSLTCEWIVWKNYSLQVDVLL